MRELERDRERTEINKIISKGERQIVKNRE